MRSFRVRLGRLIGWTGHQWFYILGFTIMQGILGWMWFHYERGLFVQTSARLSGWGVTLSIIYQAIIVFLMMITKRKNTLDRRWIWHSLAIIALFAYAWIAIYHPHILGAQIPPRFRLVNPTDRQIGAAVVLYNIWGFIAWSAFSVMLSVWSERGRFVWTWSGRALKDASSKIIG